MSRTKLCYGDDSNELSFYPGPSVAVDKAVTTAKDDYIIAQIEILPVPVSGWWFWLGNRIDSRGGRSSGDAVSAAAAASLKDFVSLD